MRINFEELSLSRRLSRRCSICRLAVMLVVLFITSFAQAPVSEISGSVFDEPGAMIPVAQVTVTNSETGVSRRHRVDCRRRKVLHDEVTCKRVVPIGGLSEFPK